MLEDRDLTMGIFFSKEKAGQEEHIPPTTATVQAGPPIATPGQPLAVIKQEGQREVTVTV